MYILVEIIHTEFQYISLIEIENELRKEKHEKKETFCPGCHTRDKRAPLLSRTGVPGWEIGTTAVSQPGQINIFVVVYPAYFSLTAWMCTLGGIQSAVFAAFMQHKPQDWPIGFGLKFWCIVYSVSASRLRVLLHVQLQDSWESGGPGAGLRACVRC